MILGGCILNVSKARFSKIEFHSFADYLDPFTASAQFSKFKVT